MCGNMVMPFYHFSQFFLSNFILMNLILKIKSKLLVIGGNYRQLQRWNTIISIIFFLLFTFWPIRIWKLSSRLPSKWSHVYSSYAAKVYILLSLFWRISCLFSSFFSFFSFNFFRLLFLFSFSLHFPLPFVFFFFFLSFHISFDKWFATKSNEQ